MELCILANGITVRSMGEENRFGKTEVSMKVCGRKEKVTERED